MNENQDKPEDQLAEEPQIGDEEQRELRKISEEELKKILEDHQKYIKSEGKDGKIAELSGADLSGADLSWANFSGANFSGANFSRADLSGADLSGANFSRADLSWANFSGADLSWANFSGADLSQADLSRANLSGAIVDAETLLNSKNIKKPAQIGVNGIWIPGRFGRPDSAALMSVTPPGNSMQGPNPDAVIESLKRARRLHGFSMSLVGIIILIAILNLTEIKFPWAENVKVTPSQFGLLAMPMSIGLLILVGSFMSDALKGVRYLQDRSSAMSVGNFPWSLSKYSGSGARPLKDRILQIADSDSPWKLIKYAGEDKIAQFLSFTTRMVMSFHPITYIFILQYWQVFNPIVFYVLSILTLALSGWVLHLSEQFQKPILFDRKTEEEKKENIEKLTEVVKELVDILKPKENEKIETNDSDGDSSNGTKTR